MHVEVPEVTQRWVIGHGGKPGQALTEKIDPQWIVRRHNYIEPQVKLEALDGQSRKERKACQWKEAWSDEEYFSNKQADQQCQSCFKTKNTPK